MSDRKDLPQNSPPEIGCLNEADKQRFTQEYPRAMEQLHFSALIVADALKVYEASVNGSQPTDDQDPRYSKLADTFRDFMFDCNYPEFVKAEGRAAEPGSTVDRNDIAFWNINFERDDIPGIRDLLKKGKPVAAMLVEELYDERKPSHRQLVEMGHPAKRAVRAVALCLAAKLDNWSSDRNIQSMIKNTLSKEKVDTPWGNPIDVAQNMLKKSGFTPKS